MKKMLALALIITFVLIGCSTNKTNEVNSSKKITEDSNSTPKMTNNSNTIGKTNGFSDSSHEHVEKNSQETEQPVVLYCGIPIGIADREVNFFESKDEVQTRRLISRYEGEFYLYRNNNFIGKSKGQIVERGLDYYWQVMFGSNDNDYEVANSQGYNPYPREIKRLDSNLPKEFNDGGKVLNKINKEFDVNCKTKELISIDLDGDGENEYLSLAVDEQEYFFAKCLVDSKYNIISYLTVFNEGCETFNEVVDTFNYLNAGEIVDINNDGVMEIIVDLPSYEFFMFKVFTYKDGSFDGDFITKGSFQP